MPLADGQVFAGYTIVRSLGAGGMGEVYLAQHPRLPRRDALKVLPADERCDQQYRARFHREADIAAALWHPHIVEVHDRGEYEGQLWIAMDYVEGKDAAELLYEQYPNGMPPDEVVRIVTAIAEALDYAHQRQLLHRDIKPSNILLANNDSDDERVLLADFGIARWAHDTSGLTGTDMTVGTVMYAAPEQLMGQDIDGRADQYALAATAFHLLTGAPPFQHSNPAVVISQHLTSMPPEIGSMRPELSNLGPVFSRALAKSPDERYDRCIDFARALEHRLSTSAADLGAAGGAVTPLSSRIQATDATTPALRASTGPRHASAAPPSRRRFFFVVAAIVALVVVAALAVGAFFLLHRDPPKPAAKPPASAQPSTSASAPAPGTVPLPVVVVGANCATLGEAGLSESGAPAYCAHLSTTNATIWSLYPGEVSSPTATPGTGGDAYGPEHESPVLVCMEQTGKSRLQCHQDILRGNMTNTSPSP